MKTSKKNKLIIAIIMLSIFFFGCASVTAPPPKTSIVDNEEIVPEHVILEIPGKLRNLRPGIDLRKALKVLGLWDYPKLQIDIVINQNAERRYTVHLDVNRKIVLFADENGLIQKAELSGNAW